MNTATNIRQSDKKETIVVGQSHLRERNATELCLLLSHLTYSSPLKMEAVHSLEILVDFYEAIWHIPEDSTLHGLCLLPIS